MRQHGRVQKFDSSRAAEYEEQSRIALAGYDACHELTACLLRVALGAGSQRRLLIAGAGGPAKEITLLGEREAGWTFTAVDPSSPMMEIARSRIRQADMNDRVEFCEGYVHDLPENNMFDGATLIGVLHHLPGESAKIDLLASIAKRLRTGAPFVLAGNCLAYADHPLFLGAWAERWRSQGVAEAEVHAKLGRILEGADPPKSENKILELLDQTGFERPQRFFSSLFWGAWIAFKK
ncbi:MAG: methyltransferase domain-containing protein [Armatimonadetes bacterium]|nr:methyltransferase domain-containing protein [Armatimonadota bacterium]